jgi:ATP-dependent RNA helicase DOB1
MQTDDLFAFLDEDESCSHPVQSGPIVEDVEMDEDESLPPKMRKKKRKAVEAAMAAEALETSRTTDLTGPTTVTVAHIRDYEQEDVAPASKRPRLASPKPVVVDEFQTEAKREVAASAGLTGTVETGQRLELRHQVWFL